MKFFVARPDLDRKIRSIYASWTRPIPSLDEAENDPRFRPPTPQPRSRASSRLSIHQTAPRRLTRFTRNAYDSEPDFRGGDTDSISSSGNTMDWACEDNYLKPRYKAGSYSGVSEDANSSDDNGDAAAVGDKTPPRRLDSDEPEISSRRRRSKKTKLDDDQVDLDPNGAIRLTRNSLGIFDRKQETSTHWDKDSIPQWFRDIEPMPSLKRRRSHPY